MAPILPRGATATISTVARGTLGAVLAVAREASSSSRDQGDRFERLIAAAFEASPSLGFDKVWRWSEWPGARGPDIGVSRRRGRRRRRRRRW